MRKRLNLGCMLLEKGIMPTAVSNILKFSDYTAFYRAFKKEYNIAKWSELENVRYFYNFIKKHEKEFESE